MYTFFAAARSDQDYAGGGPVLAVTSAAGLPGILHIYHGEAHEGTCSTFGHCTYASLGMAFSTDGGATFSKLGEIVRHYLTRSAILGKTRILILEAQGAGSAPCRDRETQWAGPRR